jgi:hypothetical protein
MLKAAYTSLLTVSLQAYFGFHQDLNATGEVAFKKQLYQVEASNLLCTWSMSRVAIVYVGTSLGDQVEH